MSDAITYLGDDLGSLGRDFPLSEDVDFGERCGMPEHWDDHVARLAANPSYVGAFQALKARYLGFDALPGRLPVCEYGCGDFFFLVVKGPRRGTVWVDSVEGSTGLYCLEVDFLEFCERWGASLLEPARSAAPGGGGYAYLEFGRNPRYPHTRS